MPKQSSPTHPPGKAGRRRPAKRNRTVTPPTQRDERGPGPGRPSLITDTTRTTAMIRAAELGTPKGGQLAQIGRITRETLDQWWKQSDADKQAQLVTDYTRFTDQIEAAWGTWNEWAMALLDKHAEKDPNVIFRKLRAMHPEEWTEVRRSEVSGPGGKPVELETSTVIEFTLPTNGFEHPDALRARAGIKRHPKARTSDNGNGARPAD